MFAKTNGIGLILTLLAMSLTLESVDAQNRSRTDALRSAQNRAQRIAPLPSQVQYGGQRYASNGSVFPATSTAPIVGAPGAPGVFNNAGVVSSGPVIGGGSPVVPDGYIPNMGGGGIYQSVEISNGHAVGGCSGGGCNFTRCGSGACGGGSVGRPIGGGVACADLNANCANYWQNCWLQGFRCLFRNTELFGGAQAFRSRNFFAGDQLIDDSSFGFHGGFNLGLPLYPLTFGLLSGQVGVRSVQSEFDGDLFSTDNRDQLFITAGLFRRVDCGLQFGVVFDYLYEEWFAETDLAQVRGDVGWVCPGGNTFGFRFAIGTEDHLTNGIINGDAFDNLFAEVIDNYRFYYRLTSGNGGFCDMFAGWSDDDQAVLGMDFDLPVSGWMAMQSGFTYFLPDDQPDNAIVSRDAWNLYAGFSIRPQGPCWYQNCDRPLFNVADNGTFVMRRERQTP